MVEEVDNVQKVEDASLTSHEVKRKKEKSIKIDRERRRVRKHKKKQLLRPNSPAAYPSPLPIRNEYFAKDGKKYSTNDCDRILENNNKEGNVKYEKSSPSKDREFLAFRVHYLIVHIAIMLADGLQGTHLYVLYEGYGYTVASLYCLGFVSGAFTSPFVGPLVDRIGRRNSAVAYCALEIAINLMEQYDNLLGLVVSRVVGGITTNLLFTVFESWLVTEHRRRGFSEDKVETVLRDSVVASNLSAIASGCLAHICASYYGPTGPFAGAVTCTFVALVLVATRWEENYGSDVPGMKSIQHYMSDAFTTIISDSKIYRIGIIQGLTEGALQTFVFLWSPALRHFASNIPIDMKHGVIGIDAHGEPCYGLIFGAFMASGALGGVLEPTIRQFFSSIIFRNSKSDDLASKGSPPKRVMSSKETDSQTSDISCEDDNEKKVAKSHEESDSEEEGEDCEGKPVAVELLASFCFMLSAVLLSTPMLMDEKNPWSFSISLTAFLIYEFIVGVYMPCEGVLRSIYMPNDSICSLMTMLRVIVNISVALGVISTNYIPFSTAFGACSGALCVATLLQLSLVSDEEWSSIYILRQMKREPSSPKLFEIDNSSSTSVPDLKSLSPCREDSCYEFSNADSGIKKDQ